MMCGRCAELEAQIVSLKAELGHVVEPSSVQQVMRGFGLTGQEAETLLMLHGAGGNVVAAWRVMERLHGSTPRDMKLIQVLVCRIRKRLGANAIDNVWGRGYMITDVGKAKVDAVIGERVVA